MTIEELTKIFAADGIPTAFRAWPVGAAPPLPYKTWVTPYNNNFAADNYAYSTAVHVQLELYTQRRDTATEKKVEDNLDAAKLFWTKAQEYLEDEECIMTIYEMEILEV